MVLRALPVLLAVWLLIVLTACDAAGPSGEVPPTRVVPATLPPTATDLPPTETPAPTAVSLNALKGALQQVVDGERTAVKAASKDRFMAQIDRGDRPWYKLREGQFTDDADVIARYNCVSNVRMGPNGQTAEADVAIDSCPGSYHAGMFFRLVNAQWLESQPGLDEQGLRDTRKIGPFRVTFHAMDAQYLPALEHFAPAIYARVSSLMGIKDLDVDVDLISRPSDMPQGAFTTIALYDPRVARMSVLSPYFWPIGDGSDEQLDNQIKVTLTHEFTHHAVRTISLLSCPHWLNEGMAVYVSGENPSFYNDLVQEARRAGQLQPPENLNALLQDGQTAGLSYAEGYSFVHYVTAQKGNSILHSLLRALSKTDDLDASLQAVTGQGLARWWTAWVRSLSQ